MRFRDFGKSMFVCLFRLGVISLLSSLVGCRTTIDNLGYNDSDDAAIRQLRPISGPAEYPNAFRDVLGKSNDEIRGKIDNAFNTLFHGNPADQSFFVEVGSDEGYIKDILHNDEIRTEGMGYGMIIAVQLNKRPEFNRLWRYAKHNLMIEDGPARGYFNSHCDIGVAGSSTSQVCLDPFGLQQFAMALVLAHGRWGSDDDEEDASLLNYNDDAWMLFDVMRNKEEQNGGVVDGVTNTFDSRTLLVFNEPDVADFNYTRPSLAMPAYYEMWAQATGDPFWSAAAGNARGFWKSVAHGDTGLMPVRAYFSGNGYDAFNVFASEGYRTQLNLALDKIWIGTEPWEETEANLLMDFFQSVIDANDGDYFMTYELDGTVIDSSKADTALISVNGDTALVSSSSNREAFISAVWNAPLPTGPVRYYSGLLYMLSLLTLSGEYRVY